MNIFGKTKELRRRRFSLERAAGAAGWQRELAGGGHAPETEQYGVGSFVWRSARAFHPERLWRRVLEGNALPPVLRSKARRLPLKADHPSSVEMLASLDRSICVLSFARGM